MLAVGGGVWVTVGCTTWFVTGGRTNWFVAGGWAPPGTGPLCFGVGLATWADAVSGDIMASNAPSGRMRVRIRFILLIRNFPSVWLSEVNFLSNLFLPGALAGHFSALVGKVCDLDMSRPGCPEIVSDPLRKAALRCQRTLTIISVVKSDVFREKWPFARTVEVVGEGAGDCTRGRMRSPASRS